MPRPSKRTRESRERCAEKTTYRSWSDATRSMIAHAKRGRTTRAYRCRHCGRWHLTSQL